MSEENTKILVVDYDEKNRTMFSDLIGAWGYSTDTASNGKDALNMLKTGVFDLIMLDAMIPEMDSFLVLKNIKENEVTKCIPVILITAPHDSESKLKGIKLMADDFINKPVYITELRTKITALIKSRKTQKELEKFYNEFKKLNELKNNLTAMIVHDIKNPLAVVLSTVEFMLSDGKFTQEMTENLDIIYTESKKAINLATSLLDIEKLESGTMKIQYQPFNIWDIIQREMHLLTRVAKLQRTKFLLKKQNPMPLCYGDINLISRVVTNLLDNALRHSPKDGTITISAAHDENNPEFIKACIENQGTGIPKEFHEKIFDKFMTVEMLQNTRRYSTGLGLTFCKMVVEIHQGKIWVESELNKNCRFCFTIPIVKEEVGK
ncbi:MAG TPA: ATP-binding protein [bacterium]